MAEEIEVNESTEISPEGRHPDANLMLTFGLVGFLALCMFSARVMRVELSGDVLLGLAALLIGYVTIVFGMRKMPIQEGVEHLEGTIKAAVYIYLVTVLLIGFCNLFSPRDLGMSSELYRAQRHLTGEVPALIYAWLILSALLFVKVGVLVTSSKYWKPWAFTLLVVCVVVLDFLIDMTDGGAVDVPILGTLGFIKVLALGAILALGARQRKA